MIYREHKCGSFNIHTIKTNKFKTIRLEIVLRNNIDRDSIATRTLLFDMLVENSKEYPTKRDLVLKQESLYNALLFSSSNRMGGTTISTIVLDFLNPSLTNDDYLEDAIKLPFELIFNPNITNNEFDSKTLEGVKTRTIADIKCINENPQRLSFKNALEAFDPDSLTSINITGSIEDVEAITPSSLFETYINVLKHDYIDVYIIGDINEEVVVDYISKYAAFNTIKNHEITMPVINNTRKKVLEVKETSNFQQSHLINIYNLIDLTDYEKKYVFNIYNTIIGGGMLESKLYKNLRGKNSLCYGVHSLYQKHDGIMLTYTSVDKKNINKANKLIEETIEEMINNVTEEELNIAIESIISSINMSLDIEGRIVDQYLYHNISDLDTVEERLKTYKKVTVEDVKKVAKKVKLNTSYVLEGEEHGEN